MIGDGGEYQTVGGGARNVSRLLFLISCLPFLLAFPASPCTSINMATHNEEPKAYTVSASNSGLASEDDAAVLGRSIY